MGQASSAEKHGARDHAAAPALTKAVLDQLAHDRAEDDGSDEGSQDERESFGSWRSDPRGPGSVAIGRPSQGARASDASSGTPMSSGATTASGGGEWNLDQRPSADTPLPGSSMAACGSSMFKGSEPGVGMRSCSQDLQRASLDSHGQPRFSLEHPHGQRGTSLDAGNTGYSPAGSARSSFALERASMEANRASLEAFKEAFAIGPLVPHASKAPAQPSQPTMPSAAGPAISFDQVCLAAQVPAALREKFARLCVLPPNTPAPASMLAKLWQADTLDVKSSLAALAAKGLINVAQLPDSRVWCLPQPQQLELVRLACQDAAPHYHRLLLDAYCHSTLPSISEEATDGAGAAALAHQQQRQQHHAQAQHPQQHAMHARQQQHWQPPQTPQVGAAAGGSAPTLAQHLAFQQPLQLPQRLQDVPDDGYILINLGHHLTAGGRHLQLRELLLDPDWLRRKLIAAGTTAVVADFRRYLLLDNCADIKTVLEAFQLSAAQAVAYPRAPGLLRCLMASRLITAPLSMELQAWLGEQRRRIYDDSRTALLSGFPRCLPPLTPSLDQAGGLQRLALRGHNGAVTKVLLTPSGTDAVTASADGTARVWDLDIGDCVLLLEGHSGPVTDMAVTSDGSLVLTCSTDGTARAFEMERGQCLRVLAGHTACINALAMDPWARFVVTASSDGTARVWDLSSARAVHVLQTGCTEEQGGVLSVALSPCTRFAILGCANNSARMYDVVSGRCMGIMSAHTGWVNLVRFLPDGKKAVTGSHDGTARVWDLHNGTCRHTLAGHTGRINALEVAGDGKWAATASEDCTVRIWDLRRGTCRRVLTGHKSWVSSIAISPCGDKLVTTSGDGTALVYSIESGDMLCLLEGHSAAVHAAVVTRKGRFAVTVSEDSSVRVWDFGARMVQPASYHEGKVYCIAGSASGTELATCGEDCDARVWDAERGTFQGLLHRHKVPIRWASFSADGSHLVTVSPDRTVLLWDVATLSLLRHVPVSEGSRIRSFAASADLSRAVICKWDSTVCVVDLHSGQVVSMLQRWGQRDSTTGHSSAVNQVLITQDGKSVVTLSKDTTARIWDAATGACLHVLEGHTDAVLGGCINDAARLLATHSFDDSVRLWALDTGVCINCVKLPDTPQHVALSPDGWKVAVALSNAAVCVFDVEDKQPGALWEFHGGDITGLQFSADGAELMSCALDSSVCVWDASTGAITGLFVGDCNFTCCWYNAAQEQLCIGTDRGIVHCLDLGLVPRGLATSAFATTTATGQAAAAADALAQLHLQPPQQQQQVGSGPPTPHVDMRPGGGDLHAAMGSFDAPSQAASMTS